MKASFLALLVSAFSVDAQCFCFAEAANRYGVDQRLLAAIAKVESNFNPAARHVNSDLSVDVGLMQINSQHLRELSRYQITERSLLDPCVSANVGAWVLAGAIRTHGANWRAVGAYNAGNHPNNEGARQAYAKKVFNALSSLSQMPAPNHVSPKAVPPPKMQVIE
jgi:soluble lytic murein transglycosylase-like protein